ncbi:MAG: PEP-CTERM sorting domain-containing protein [Myxococcales bacterium]|nr:PEP-CTERM sorting domain-containing protein [Myxococcales bacterium]
MRKLLGITGAALLALFLVTSLAGTATAATLNYDGTYRLYIGDFQRNTWKGFGSGVATVNGSGGGAHLSTLRLPGGGITMTGTAFQTDPETPTLVSLRIDPARPIPLPRGTLNGISGGPPLGTQNTLTGLGILPQAARLQQCILLPGCSNYLPIPVTKNGTLGAGIGGTITVNTFSKGGGLKLSNVNAPWTLGAAVISGNPNRITLTVGGVITNRYTIHTTRTESGFVHGPASGTSNTAQGSGVIQVVTPILTKTSLAPPNNFLAVWGVVRLHFVPEPGMLLLIGSGIAGLVVLGRHRMRK